MALPEPKELQKLEEEKIPLVEIKEGKISPEIKDYITKIETAAEINLPQPVTDDDGQVITDNAQPQKVTIVLPLNEEKIRKGLHYKIVSSFRWLAEWCLRLVKIVHGRFIYRGAET